MTDWKSDLSDFFDKQGQKAQTEAERQKETQSDVKEYLSIEVMPALEELRSELEKHGRQISVHEGAESAGITVGFQGNEEFQFSVKAQGSRVYPETRFRERTNGKMYRAEGSFRGGATIYDVKKDEIIKYFLEDYQRHTSR
jgi:hypothetical protein